MPQENTESKDIDKSKVDSDSSPDTPVKPLKPEEKPFEVFITEHLLPGIEKALKARGSNLSNITFKEVERPVVGGLCWSVIGELEGGGRFWLSFSKNQIASSKTIALAEDGSEPSLLESFLIDEKKTTLALLISRLLQRLNGQKWLDPN